MKTSKVFFNFATTLSGLTLSISAFALTPHLPDLVQDGNRWTITFYDDSSTAHNQWATQGLCFYYAGTVGTQQRYIWASDTYPDWNGQATQEGDQIFMHGDFQWPQGNKNGGHDGMEWEIVTSSPKNEGAGHWKEWVESERYGATIGFGNAKFQRVGKCRFTTHNEALEYNLSLEAQQGSDGSIHTNPMGVNIDKILDKLDVK